MAWSHLATKTKSTENTVFSGVDYSTQIITTFGYDDNPFSSYGNSGGYAESSDSVSPNPDYSQGTWTALNKTIASSTWLYASYGTPRITAVNQGHLGDCWLLASLEAVDAVNPSFIKNMLSYSGAGIFSVRLYQGSTQITVEINDQLNSSVNNGNSNGNWASLIEKAFAVDYGNGDYQNLDGDWTSTALTIITGEHATDYYYYQIVGNDALKNTMIDDLTGVKAGAFAITFSSDYLFIPSGQGISSAVDFGKDITKGAAEGKAVTFTDLGNIGSSHAYAVIGYDAKTGGFLVGNPWGHGDPYSGSAISTTYPNDRISPSDWWCTFPYYSNIHYYATFELSWSDIQQFVDDVTICPIHIAPTVTAVSSISVIVNQSIDASSLISSITNPSGDTISLYIFKDDGAGGGYFTIDGVKQAANQWIYPASSSNVVKYVGGSGISSETLEVGIYDYTKNCYYYSSTNVVATTINVGDNVVNGDSGNNTLTGTASVDVIFGFGGNDTLVGLGSGDLLDGGDGVDTASYAASGAAVNVSLFTGTGSGGDAEGDTLANIENLTGSAYNDLLAGNGGTNVLAGGAGTDTVSYENATAGVTVSLALTTAQNTVGAGTDTLSGFENLTGSAYGDTLTGDKNANVLTGGAGNDRLDGGAGTDTLRGGSGDDTYVVDNVGDVVDETSGGGTDTVLSAATFTLASGIENLTLTGTSAISGTGNDDDNVLTGNSGVNTLSGLGGDDTLDGGKGADKMYGGAGDDIYYVDNTKDVTDETVGDGTDTVYASVTFTIGAGIENLILTGTGAISGTGNALANTITGNGANNTLAGGAGVDTLYGGGGGDVLRGGYNGDTLDGGDGVDTASYADAPADFDTFGVVADLSGTTAFGIDTLVNIENLLGSNYDDWLVGDANANRIDGGSGDDEIEGLGGDDTLIGGKGTDTVSYAYATSGVTVSLATTAAQNTVGAGIDTLSTFEDIIGSAYADVLTGSSSANELDGGAGDDRLDGGKGADWLIGGFGDDTYVVDNAGDVVDDDGERYGGLGGDGTDLVLSAVAFNLSDAAHAKGGIENLTLTGTKGVAATGNAGDNILVGNSGANTLTGLGGNDMLTGLGGKDTFAFTAVGFGQDTITDFDLSKDVLKFNPALFANYAAAMGHAAQVGSDTVVTYDATDTVTLANVTMLALTSKNFAFG